MMCLDLVQLKLQVHISALYVLLVISLQAVDTSDRARLEQVSHLCMMAQNFKCVNVV